MSLDDVLQNAPDHGVLAVDDLLGRLHRLDDAALDAAVACKGVPTVILADTVKGKGVSFMEGKSAWHGKAIPDAEFAQAMQELGGNV